jgi:Cys-rich protein (TIGR01571 family)
MFFRQFMMTGGPIGNEPLDQPLSNFDVIGVPTGEWSSHIFACYENILPSCIVSFMCPCVMWGQIVIRAQIPLLISIKNSLPCFRGKSGYGFFVDFFFWTLILLLFFFLVAGLVTGMPSQVNYLFYVLGVILAILFIYPVSHTRTAFREKYKIGVFPFVSFF